MHAGTLKLGVRNTAAVSAEMGRRGQTGKKNFKIMQSAGVEKTKAVWFCKTTVQYGKTENKHIKTKHQAFINNSENR